MKVSKRQLLRIIREEADAVDEARLRRKIRSALMNESRAGLFGAIGFQGLGQTNHRDPGIGWGREHAQQVRRDSLAGRNQQKLNRRVVKEQAGGDAKNVLYKTVIPALEDAGFKGIEAFKMLRKVTQVMEDDLRAMLGPRE